MSTTAGAGADPDAAPMQTRLRMPWFRLTTPPITLGIAVAAAFILAESATVVFLTTVAPHESFGVLYLLGVLVVSIMWGPALAGVTSILSAVAFDYFRDWPAGHFGPFNLANTIVFGVFLAVALLTNFVAGVARAGRDRANSLARHQTALRRVATLVARGVSPSDVASAVAAELVGCVQVDNARVGRYERSGAAALVTSARIDPRSRRVEVDERQMTVDDDSVAARVLRTARPVRVNDGDAGTSTTPARRSSIPSAIGTPVEVDGRVWGFVSVGCVQPYPMPSDTEARITDFADLMATAITNDAIRSELIASRTRIVTAADEARRRLERDLHDGAQQRLVSLSLNLRMAEASLPKEEDELKRLLSQVLSGLSEVSKELQEISRGIHPAILASGGLHPALKALARRSAVPVELNIAIDSRLSERSEVGAYYVVAEALTNAAKHAQAGVVKVSAEIANGQLNLVIEDDGVGGADSAAGSGLIGLVDRVEALGGEMRIFSPAGGGTTLRARIPART